MKKTLLLLNIFLFFIGVSTALSQVPSYVPTNGLVGWWPFNGNANDESGNGNNGTVNGATLTTDRFGVANKAYSFDGVDDYILNNSNTGLGLNSRTIDFWMKTSGASLNPQVLIDEGGSQCGSGFAIVNLNPANFLRFDNSCSYKDMTSTFGLNQWINVVIVFDNSISNGLSGIKFYINGDLIMNYSSLNGANLNINSGNSLPLTFAKSRLENNYFFNGNLDDIGIWNRALTEQEIINLYTYAVPPPPPTASITPSASQLCTGGSTTLTASTSVSNVSACASTDLPATLQNGLVGYWPFCGNANDESGNGNNGTVNGATLTADRFGNANSAYSFDGGLNTKIVSNLSSPLQGTKTFSIWMNLPTNFINPYCHLLTCNNSGSDYLSLNGNSSVYVANGSVGKYYDGKTGLISSMTLNNTLWNHIVVIHDYQNNNSILYINGQPNGILNSGNFSNNPVITQIVFGSTTLNVAGSNATLFGKLDDIAIWNRALTAAEIQQLYTQGQTTYSWSPSGETTPSITVSPTSTTTYTCTATVNGQSATSSQTITVNPLPAVNAGIDVSLCTGNSTTLSGSGANTYTWDNNVTNGVAFTPATSGTYTVTGTDANGCVNTDQVLVTVNGLPNVNAGIDQIVCAGVPVTLNGAGAATYSWNNNVTNGVPFLPVSSGTFTVTGTGANGCTANDQVMVTIIPLPLVNAGADQAVCAGTSVTLNGSGATTYSWNNGVVNGVAFTPNTTTTYSLTGTNQMGCTWNDQVVVTVNTLPTVNAGSDQMICAGTAITLNGSGASTYAWDNNVSNGVAFTPVSSGTYTVTGTNANGCTNSDQVFVMVNALPTVNAGADQSVCAGTAVTLSASGANTYAWNNNVSNGLAFTPTASGTYSVTGTDGNGCTNSDQIAVTVNPLPTVNAGADQSICKGAAVTLSGTGATTYAWNNNVTNSVAFNPIATATYSVSGTDANGCANADEVIVTVNEASASTLTESAMDSFTLNGQTYTQSGTYTQTLTNAAGCDSTITLNLTLSFTGLGELTQGIRIFPNPANDVLNIESTSPLVGEYTIHDAAGRVILQGTFTGVTTSIDVRNIAPGTYTLQAKELLERVVVLRR